MEAEKRESRDKGQMGRKHFILNNTLIACARRLFRLKVMDSGYIKGETGNKEGVDIYIMNPWRNFTEGYWQSEIDVREFIQLNYSPYEGDESFLAGPTRRTKKLWDKTTVLLEEENKKGGTLNIDTIPFRLLPLTDRVIDKDLEVIVGCKRMNP